MLKLKLISYYDMFNSNIEKLTLTAHYQNIAHEATKTYMAPASWGKETSGSTAAYKTHRLRTPGDTS